MILRLTTSLGTIINLRINDYIHKSLIRVVNDNSKYLIDYIQEDIDRYNMRNTQYVKPIFLSNYQCRKIHSIIKREGICSAYFIYTNLS